MDNPSDHLVRKIFIRKEELLNALTSPEFYVELIFIGVALALAWLIALLITRRLKAHLAKHPPRRIDSEFLTRPLALLPSLLALLYLSVLKPFAAEYNGGVIIDSIIQLCLAWLAARCVLLLVRSTLVGAFIAII